MQESRLSLTEQNRLWLDRRFERGADGSYHAHEPIYGLEHASSSEPNPLIRYARIFQVLRLLNRMLPFGRLLDVGGAEGFVAHLARTVFDVEVVNFDLSKEANLRAREFFDLDGIAGVADQLPFASGAFDVVVCLEVIEHLERPVHALVELDRVARHGLIVSSENFVPTEQERTERLARRRLHSHFDRNCYLTRDVETALGAGRLEAVDQHRGAAYVELTSVPASEEMRELLLKFCPRVGSAGGTQVVATSKRGPLQADGPMDDETLLDALLREAVDLDGGRYGLRTRVADGLLGLLACPDCQAGGVEVPLAAAAAGAGEALVCERGAHHYDLENGVPLLYPHDLGPDLEARLAHTALAPEAREYLLELDSRFATLELSYVEARLEHPETGAAAADALRVIGWATGIPYRSPLTIRAIVDGETVGGAPTEIMRPDVAAHFAPYNVALPAETGFDFVVGVESLEAGPHELVVMADGSGGESIEIGRKTFSIVW